MKRFFLIPLLGLLLALVGCTCTVSGNDPMTSEKPTAAPTPAATRQPTAAPAETVAPVMPTAPIVSPSAPATAGN